eukprot:gene16759-19927_t
MELRADSLAALQEFMKEKAAKELEEEHQQDTDIGEDWGLSQFWYEPSTSELVAKAIAIDTLGTNKRVLCLSTPSIFRVLYHNQQEFDKRFSVFGDRFSFYDYKSPLDFPEHYKESFDLICFDPPFLSEECLERVSHTIKALSHSNTRLILLTGRIQWPHIQKLFPGMHICEFMPEHSRLKNDFFSCSNYTSTTLGVEQQK